MTAIERLRALEKKWRETEPTYTDPIYYDDADRLTECADELATLIAELGQEVGAVADAVEVLRQKLANDEDGWRALCVVMAALPTSHTSEARDCPAPPPPNSQEHEISDEYAILRAAQAAGARIQVWRLRGYTDSSADGEWVTLAGTAQFSCPAHLYRVHPEDISLIAELGQEVGAVAPVSFAVELADGTLGALGWIEYAKFEQVKNMGTLANGARYVFAYRTSPAHTSEARDAARYRWLRDAARTTDFDTPRWTVSFESGGWGETYRGETLDKHIDAAMEGGNG